MSEFSTTREEALEALDGFIPRSGKYSRGRNAVVEGHTNVSCLSPAIRHRLLTEWEVAEAPLERYAASTVEKFTQEIYWRSYWKGWLSMRPEVWTGYEASHEEPFSEKAEAVMAGKGPIAVMNSFAKELTRTGYLHNHARMWFAGYWIHVARLPWEQGARFFERNLLDFDPASNTLSWRWVAGLQTPGKTYLPRRGNIEKYLAPELLDPMGLETLESPVALVPMNVQRPEITRPDLPSDHIPASGGLWIHEEDLNPESSPLTRFKPDAILVSGNGDRLSEIEASENRRRWTDCAIHDAASRTKTHFGTEVECAMSADLIAWAQRNQLRDIVALRPEIGPLHDKLPALQAALAKENIALHLIIRPEDQILRPFAKSGFFPFWKKLQTRLKKGEFPLNNDVLPL
ncbi:MAG: FAD-binding domain-containing protein [Akkermansiaceae bacterium]